MNTEKTILHFHTGRGGRFNNQGHVTFCGVNDIGEVLSILDSGKHNTYLEGDVYTDCNGGELITVAEVETGVGILDWDGDYDTDVCKFLEDCSEDELIKVLGAGYEYIIREYFDECTDLGINWSAFNGDYEGLIEEYFNFGYSLDISDFFQ